MQGYKNYGAIKIEGENKSSIHDGILIESPLQIEINHSSFTVVMRTPGHDRDLAMGLLYNESILKPEKSFNVTSRKNDKGQDIINFEIAVSNLGDGYLNKRSLLSVSSCGICGKQDLDGLKIENPIKLDASRIQIGDSETLFLELRNKQILFEHTGGSHAAAALNSQGDFLVIREDIGRHNAVDKVIGSLLTQEKIKEAKVLLVSGRVSYEIVSKAFFAKIPNILSVSACSSLAIDMAKELGISLIGFNRGKNATRYN